MADDQRVYSDEEFAVILRKAAEMPGPAEATATSQEGLTLNEMKAAAAQAGLDPALVERAAQMLVANTPASPFERLIGGPLRHEKLARLPIPLDESTAARLLSAVRINAGVAGSRDRGHSSAMGMTWHDGGELESLRVTAQPDGDGTTVSVGLDRRGTLAVVTMMSGMAGLMVLLFAVFALYPEAPALGIGGAIAGTGGILAAARGYWTSSTKRVRERTEVVMKAIEQALNTPRKAKSGSRGSRNDADLPESDATIVDDAELTGT